MGYIINPELLYKYQFLDPLNKLLLQFDQLMVIRILVISFFFIFLLKNLINYFGNKFILKFIFNFGQSLYKKIMLKIYHQNYLFFLKNKVGEISTVSGPEIQSIKSCTQSILLTITELIILLNIIFLILFVGQYKILFLVFPVILIILPAFKVIHKKIKNMSHDRIFLQEKSTLGSIRMMQGVREIIISGRFNFLFKKIYALTFELNKIDYLRQSYQQLPKIFLEIFGVAIMLCFILFTSESGENLSSSLIILTFYFTAAYRMLPSLNKIFSCYQNIKITSASIKLINKYLELNEDRMYLETEDQTKIKFNKKIVLENISFSYGEKDILKKLNFEVQKGEAIGIYGDSGSGKSTLLGIISGLLIHDDGTIKIDEQKINNKQLVRQYQNNIFFISQDSFLMGDTIKEIITYGNDQFDFDEDLFKLSIKLSNLSDYISSLPVKENSLIDVFGKNLSSGQKQRLNIARSIYSQKEILIFDEATNALDEENEKNIMQQIYNLKKFDKTIIIVSHNKNNLIKCDKVFKLNNGQLNKVRG